MVLLGCLGDPAGAAAPPAASETIAPYDLKLIGYVENAHGQLDEWTARLLARLDRDLGPREREPITDGRADLQVAKIRVTYAGRCTSPELAALFHELADAHEARLAAVRSRLADRSAESSDSGTATADSPRTGTAVADAPRVANAPYDLLDDRVADLISRIRNWRDLR